MRSTSTHAAKFLATVVLAGWLVGPHASLPGGDAPPAARAFPLRFEARGAGGLVADTLDGAIAVEGATIALADRNGVETLRLTLRGEGDAVFEAGEPSLGPTRIVSEVGAREIATYRSLRARTIAPGVDAVVSGEGGRIELRFDIAPGTPASTISLISSAATQLDAAGRVRASSWTLGAPLTSRASDPQAAAPAALLTTAGNGGLALGLPAGDEQGPIEVRVPIWSATSGFRALDPIKSAPKLALDADGNAYVTARAPARSRESGDPGDVLVGRLDRSGLDFVWVTYLAGAGDDDPRAIAVDAQGRVAVAARGYLAQFDPASGAVIATTPLDDEPRAIATDGTGVTWVAGEGALVRIDAEGTVSRFALPGAPIEAVAVADDGSSIAVARGATVEVLSPDGKLVRSVGLQGLERIAALAFAGDGRIVLAGRTSDDAVLAAIEPGESEGRVLGLLSGPGTDEADALAVDRGGRLLVAGRASGDLGLPATPRRALLGGAEGFAAAYDADGRTVRYGAYLGGSADDAASSIVVDGNGRIWVAGSTASADTREDEATFPLGVGGVGFVVVLDDAAPAEPGGVCPGDKQFDGGAAGTGTAWETAANWSGDTLPTAGQNVCITGAFAVNVGTGSQNAGTLRVEGGASLSISAGTLTIAGTSEINGPFTMTGGTLTGAGNLTLGSTFTYNGGTLSGTGLLTPNAGIDVGTATFKTIARSVSIPAGQTVTYSATGGMAINTPATVTNAGTWNHQTDADISGTGLFVNSGTFNRTNSAGLVTISVDFNNTGNVDVQSGELALSGDGTDSGDYDSTGALLRLSGGTRSMSTNTAITGGDFEVTNGTQTFNGTYNVNGTTNMTFGTFTFTASSTVTNIGSALAISAGTFTFNSGETIAPGTIDQTGGTLTGSDAITVSGLYTFDGGSMLGTGTTTANGGIGFGTTAFRTVGRNLTIPAGQTATYSGTGGMAINTPATVTNSGTWNHQTDADISGTGILTNGGTFNRTNSAGLVTVSADFNNTGTVDVQSGILSISGDGADTGDYDSTGAILRFSGGARSMSVATAITGGDVDVTNGTYTFNGTYDITGTTSLSFGTFTWTPTSTITNIGAVVDCSGGTMTFNSGNIVAPGNVNQTGGNITGSDTINVPGLYTFDGGTIAGTGTLNANGGISFGGTAFRTISRNVLIPAGQTATYSATGGTAINTPATVTNSGTWNHQTDADISGTGILTNGGTFNRVNSAGLVTVSADFNNTGTVDVQSGILSFSGDGTDTGDYDSTGAILRFAGGTRSFSTATAITGGDVDVTNGTYTFNGTYDVAGATSLSFGNFTFTPTSVITNIGSSVTTSGGTLTLNSGDTPTPGTLTMDGGVLTGSDNINVTGLFQFDAGTHSGTGTTTANGGINFAGTAFRTLARVLIVPVGETATYAATGGMAINTPGTLTNNGTYEHQTDADVSGTGPFNNTGNFNRTNSAGTVLFSCPFNNTGAVDVQSGELRLSGNGLDSGDYDCTGAILTFSGGTRTIQPAATVTGSEVQFTGATMTINGTYDVATRTFLAFGGVTFSSQSTITNIGSTLDVDAGTFTFSSGETVTPTTLNLRGGTITGSDALSVTGLFTWESGTLSGAGAGTANGGIAMTTASSKALARNLTNATGSTLTYSGIGGLGITAPAIFANAVGATWDHQTDAQITGTGSINNLGTFNRTTSSNEVSIFTDFDNAGTVDVQTGILRLSGGGTASGSYDATGTQLRLGSGTFNFTNVSSITGTSVDFDFCTATIDGSYNVTGTTLFSGGDATFSPAATITSVGTTLDISSGNAVFNSGDAITVATLLMTGGFLRGSDNIAVTGPFDWNAGQMAGTGTTTLQGGLTIDNFGVTLARPLVNATGSTAITSGPNAAIFMSQGGSVTNQAGATWEVQNDSGLSDPGNVFFNNAGTFKRTTSTGAAHLDLPFTNTGTVDVLSGSLVAGQYLQNAGVTRLNGGNLGSGFFPIRIFGGSLIGNGSVTGSVTIGSPVPGGAFAPGLTAAGAISVSGTTTFDAGGSYDCEIGGLTAGTQHDFIGGPTSGPFVVNGTLNVSLINGFTPSIGNTFTIMQGSARNGNFATLNLPPLGGGNVWTVTYTPTTVVLNVGPPISADLSVTNVDAPDPVNAGGIVTYSVTVASAGPDPATGVTLVHTLDGTTSFVSATPSQGACGNVGGTVTCNLGNLANGANATVSIAASTSSGSVPSITASASVSATEADLNNANNTASATTTVTPVADLSIVKSDTPDPVAAAGTIAYTLDVSNAGPNGATNLTVSDNLPAGTAFLNASGTGWTCGNVGQLVTCTRPALAVGAAPSITINATAPASPGAITNNASVTATSFDPTLPNTASAGTNVTAVADISITKGDAPDPVDAGATLTYTLNVANAGPSTANAVSVTDTLPAGVTNVNATGTGWTCTPAPGSVTCTRPTLAVGAAPAITITVTAPVVGGTITNTATATAAEFDPTTPNTVSEDTDVTAIADISVVKTDSPDPVFTSSPLTYTITVTNNGPSPATGLIAIDALPAGVVFNSVDATGWSCNEASLIVTCTRPGPVPVGPVTPITIHVTTPATPGLLSNGVSAGAAEDDPNPDNNVEGEQTSVALVTADLSIVKTDSADPVNAAAAYSYTLAVANGGPDAATNITVTDTLPAGVSYVNATGTGWTCGNLGQTVTCTRPALAIGAAPAITVDVTAPSQSGVVNNTATVAGAEADNDSADNSDTEGTTVTAVANLTIAKVDTPDPVAAAGQITYTITVENLGPSTATNLTMTDTLPAGVTVNTVNNPGWACAVVAGVLTCTRASLVVGPAQDIVVILTAPASPGQITNTASVTATTADPSTPNTATTTTNVTAVADLTITKTDNPDPVNAGQNLTYTINVTNAGPSTANGVTVSDPLPPGSALQSITATGWTCGEVTGTVTCTRATLAVGAAQPITIVITPPAAGGTISNTATLTANEFDPTTPNTSTATTNVTPIADLSIVKTDTPDPVNIGSVFTYTLAVTNLGPSPAANVTVTDTLPASVTGVSASGPGWTCGVAGQIVTCTRATLAIGAAPVITIDVTAPGTIGALSNTASVATTTTDPVPGNNSDTEGTTVTQITAELSIVKTDSADPVNAGAAFSYTLAVTNAGPDPASTVTVTDTLPAGVSFVGATGTGWNCTNVGQAVTCTRPALAVGAAPPITVNVTAPAEGGALSNTASVSAPEADGTPGNNSDTEGTNITAVANLTITKSDAPDPVAASGLLVYTISVANAGPSTATGLTMTDTLPAGVTIDEITGTGWACSVAGLTVTCTRATLPVGAAPDIDIYVFVPASPGQLTNTASVTATTADPSTPNTATATTNVTAVADLTITKTDGPDPVNAGQNLTYTISVSNAGPSDAHTVTVVDTLPPGSSVVSSGGTGWNCIPSAGGITCTRPTLAPGAAPAITIVITPPPAGGTISNTATVTATEFDPTTPNTSTADTTVVPIADLSIAKTDTPDPVNIGSAFAYHLNVTNLGPSSAANVIVSDTIPAGVTIDGASGTGWACSVVAQTVTCTRATLTVGVAPVITIAVTAPGTPGSLSNSATVGSTTNDPVPNNNADTEGTTVTVVTADLSITKIDNPDPVNTGAGLTYTINVSNAGPDPANGVSVVDTLPAGVTNVVAGGTGWTCNTIAGVVTCTRATLAVGAAPPITITLTAPAAGGVITNTATVSASEADGNLANNTASTTTTVNVVADLSIAKTDSPDPVLARGTLTYTVTVTNLSVATAAGVTVTDTLPAGATYVSAGGTGWACSNVGQTVTCTRATLAAGAAPAITIVVAAPAAGGSITNTATVASTSSDPVAANNTASTTTTVNPMADLSIAKTDSADPVDAGATFSYTLAVTNDGPSTATTLSVSDPLPAGATLVSATGTGWTCTGTTTVTCTRATLAADAPPSTITINVRAPNNGGTLTNTATVTSPTQDPDAADRTDTETTTVTAVADMSIVKATTRPTVSVGAPLAWTLTVRNLGPSPATNIEVTDFLPAGVQFVSATGSGWTCTGPIPVQCTRATLAAGATSTITLNATAPVLPGSVTNTATVEAAEADRVATNDTGQSTIEAVVGPACGSLEDLLASIGDADLDPRLRATLEAPVVAAIAALAAGQPGVVSTQLGLFQKHCTTGAASGRIAAEDAQALVECAASLRSGLGSGTSGATVPAKKGGAKPATPVRRR